MICDIICVDGFLCMLHLDIVHMLSAYVSRFVSAGDALGRERSATLMSSCFTGHSGCKVT